MKLDPPRVLTARIPASLYDRLGKAAEMHSLLVSELVREALQSYLDDDSEAVTNTELRYEISKTRALLMRSLEVQFDHAQVNRMVDMAEEDAQVYAHKRQGEKDGEDG
jgi:hypothetical protein